MIKIGTCVTVEECLANQHNRQISAAAQIPSLICFAIKPALNCSRSQLNNMHIRV